MLASILITKNTSSVKHFTICLQVGKMHVIWCVTGNCRVEQCISSWQVCTDWLRYPRIHVLARKSKL